MPLALRFFAHPGRLLALQNPTLRAVLEAAVFEPGPFGDPVLTETVPAENRSPSGAEEGTALGNEARGLGKRQIRCTYDSI